MSERPPPPLQHDRLLTVSCFDLVSLQFFFECTRFRPGQVRESKGTFTDSTFPPREVSLEYSNKASFISDRHRRHFRRQESTFADRRRRSTRVAKTNPEDGAGFPVQPRLLRRSFQDWKLRRAGDPRVEVMRGTRTLLVSKERSRN